jgi:DNA mismatch endonuclease, patch repair protein
MPVQGDRPRSSWMMLGRSSFPGVPAGIRARMSRIRKRDTAPELVVRRSVHRLGYRFRLHRNDLPGTPDLVFPRLRKVIFVHGCFWHQHSCRLGCKVPQTRQDYWLPKLERNVARDREAAAALVAAGWQILIIWECEIGNLGVLEERLRSFLREVRPNLPLGNEGRTGRLNTRANIL